jgi:hypothetical protein
VRRACESGVGRASAVHTAIWLEVTGEESAADYCSHHVRGTGEAAGRGRRMNSACGWISSRNHRSKAVGTMTQLTVLARKSR